MSPSAILTVVKDVYHHSQQAKAISHRVKHFPLHPQSGFPRVWITDSTSDRYSSILIWTYHVLDKLEAVFMGNDYVFLCYSVLAAFLSSSLSTISAEAMSRLTNLHNVIQNIDERVTILEANRHVFVTHIEGPPTFGTHEARLICISSSLRLSGSSGRGSAAARRDLVQKKRRFARKPLMKTH